jgi:hypothetical protein
MVVSSTDCAQSDSVMVTKEITAQLSIQNKLAINSDNSMALRESVINAGINKKRKKKLYRKPWFVSQLYFPKAIKHSCFWQVF